jgi:hypothetical protein
MADLLKLLTAFLVLSITGACQTQPDVGVTGAPLVLERTIPLSGVRGRIDHMAIDPAHRRVFIAELGAGSVEAVDLAGGFSLGRVSDLKEPQGVAYLPARDELAVASGGDGSVRFFRARDLAPVGRVTLGADADNMRVDGQGRIVVGYGSGALAVIDPASLRVVARLDLPAHPEAFALGVAKVFVNLPDARTIVVGDLTNGRIVARWPAGHLWNFPMALDAGGGRLAVVFRLPARLQLLDTSSGAVSLDRSTCGDADDVAFDQRRGLVYVICGAGAIDDIDPARSQGSTRIRTRDGARTGLYAPDLDRLLVAAPARGSEGAALLVYRPVGPKPAPGPP